MRKIVEWIPWKLSYDVQYVMSNYMHKTPFAFKMGYQKRHQKRDHLFGRFTIGHAWVSDYGDVDKKEDFEYILKYSPLHNVREISDGQYPAILLTTGKLFHYQCRHCPTFLSQNRDAANDFDSERTCNVNYIVPILLQSLRLGTCCYWRHQNKCISCS